MWLSIALSCFSIASSQHKLQEFKVQRLKIHVGLRVKDFLIREKLVSGITDDRVREKLLGTKGLNLQTAIETLRTNQAIEYRMRYMGGIIISESTNASDTVNAVKYRKSKNERRGQPRTPQSGIDHQADNTPPL